MFLFALSLLSIASADTDGPAEIEVDPVTVSTSARIQLEWGQHLFEQGNYDAALAELQALVGHHDEPAFHWTLAKIHHAMGNEQGELEALQVFYTVAAPDALSPLRARILELGGTLPMRTLRGVQRHQMASGPSSTVSEALPFWK